MRLKSWKDDKFNRAIAQYQVATKKDMAEVLNRALRNVGFRAAQYTPKESAADIEAGLRKDKIALKIATKQLKGRVGKSYTTRKGKTRTFKRVTRAQIGRKARSLITKRKRRRGFLRAGWIAAMIAAGIEGVRKTDTLRDGKSKIGSGKKATPSKLRAYLGNKVWGRLDGKNRGRARSTMKNALKKAMRFVADDMIQHANKEMKQTAKKFSGSKRSG